MRSSRERETETENCREKLKCKITLGRLVLVVAALEGINFLSY